MTEITTLAQDIRENVCALQYLFTGTASASVIARLEVIKQDATAILDTARRVHGDEEVSPQPDTEQGEA